MKTYLPFGNRKIEISMLTNGRVADLNMNIIHGVVRECHIVPTPGGVFTKKVLAYAGMENLAALIEYWQNPYNSRELRAKLADLVFGKGPEGYEFFFQEAFVFGNGGGVSAIVGDSWGMASAKREGLIPAIHVSNCSAFV